MAQRVLDYGTATRLFQTALDGGASRPSLARVIWDIAGKCMRPVLVQLVGRPSGTLGWSGDGRRTAERTIVVGPGKPRTRLIDMETRCRRCEACRRYRAGVWIGRARIETARADRTWFGTLTLSPEQHYHAAVVASAHLARQGVDFYALPPDEQYKWRHWAIGPEITKWLKRVRKQSRAPFRVLVVSEAHKSGLPHYHCLVHEQSPVNPVRERVLHGQWWLGFSRWKLVTDPRQATYICKYLSKSSLARVRASLNYGKTITVLTPASQKTERDTKLDPPKPFKYFGETDQKDGRNDVSDGIPDSAGAGLPECGHSDARSEAARAAAPDSGPNAFAPPRVGREAARAARLARLKAKWTDTYDGWWFDECSAGRNPSYPGNRGSANGADPPDTSGSGSAEGGSV